MYGKNQTSFPCALWLLITLKPAHEIIFDLMNHVNVWTQIMEIRHYCVKEYHIFSSHVHSHVLILKVVIKGCCHFRHLLCYYIIIYIRAFQPAASKITDLLTFIGESWINETITNYITIFWGRLQNPTACRQQFHPVSIVLNKYKCLEPNRTASQPVGLWCRPLAQLFHCICKWWVLY